MLKIEWQDSWSVHEPRLDREHQGLVALINRLLDAPEDERAPEELLSVWHEVLCELMGYAESHFRYEEGLMAQAGFPGLGEHQEVHIRFRTDIMHRASKGRGTRDELFALHAFLAAWLEVHILGEDRQYIPYLGLLGTPIP